MREYQILASLSVAALLVAACSGSDEGDSASTEPPPTETAATDPAATDPAATEPAVTDPPVPEPVVSEPPVSEPVETDPPADTAAPETTAAEPAMYDFSEVGPIVDAYVTEQGLNGAGLIVVDRDDGVVHEEYWGEFDADRISLIASSSGARVTRR